MTDEGTRRERIFAALLDEALHFWSTTGRYAEAFARSTMTRRGVR